jgi:hypothetical protein
VRDSAGFPCFRLAFGRSPTIVSTPVTAVARPSFPLPSSLRSSTAAKQPDTTTRELPPAAARRAFDSTLRRHTTSFLLASHRPVVLASTK